MAELLYRLGRWSARKPWTVVGAWFAAIAIAGAGFLVGFRGLTSTFDIPGMPSSDVVEELEQGLRELSGAAGTVVFRTEDGAPLTDEQRAAISALAAGVADLSDVARVVDPFEAEQQRAQQAAALEAGRDQIEAGRAQLDAAQQQLDAGQQQADAGRTQVEAALAQAQTAGAPPETIAGLQAQLAGLEEQQAQIEAGRAQLDAGRAELAAQTETLEVSTALLAHAEPIRVVSEDGSTAVVSVTFTEPRLELDPAVKQAVIDHVTGQRVDGVEVAVSTEIAQEVPQIIGVGEIIGLLVAATVLLVMLRTLAGVLVPLATALSGVAIAVLGALAFSGVVPMAVVTPVLGVMLGLAVGIDYSLFILNRHRKQLLVGADLHESIGLANGTSGNAVVFAGSTVVVALLALNVTGIPFLGVMGNVGAVAVVAAVLIAVTLTPALLGLAGGRVLSRRARARLAEAPHAHHTAPPSAMSSPRAIATAVLTIAALLIIAIPALSMRVGLPDGASEPPGSLAQRAHVITEEQFGPGANGPLLVTAALPGGLDGGARLRAQLDVADAVAAVDGVAAVAPVAVAGDGTLAAFQVVPDTGPNSVTTESVVRDLRALTPVEGSGTLGVAGQAAINIDISERLATSSRPTSPSSSGCRC